MAEGDLLSSLPFGRTQIEQVNRNKVFFIYDFAFGEFQAQDNFFEELSRVQSSIINTGTVTLNTGEEVDLDSNGGLLALQIYTETLESTKDSMLGLAKLGLKNEQKLWTLQ